MWVIAAVLVTMAAVAWTGWRSLVDLEHIENLCDLQPATAAAPRVRLHLLPGKLTAQP